MPDRPPRHAAGPPRPAPRIERGPVPRKVERPTPGPVDIALTSPTRVRVRRPPPSRPRRWARAVRRGMGGRRGKWALIVLACLVVLLVGLVAEGFLSSPAPSLAPPAAAGTGTPSGSLPPASPSPSGSATKVKTTAPVSSDQAVLRTLKNRFPDNPLNHLTGAGIHQVVIQTSSAESVPIVGWLIPTGLSNTYGTKRDAAGHFSMSQRALGKGYLAAVFIQAGRDGTPVTCRVIVDGKVTNTETTSGPYGRTVCLG